MKVMRYSAPNATEILLSALTLSPLSRCGGADPNAIRRVGSCSPFGPAFVGLTGLRPEKWLALDRGDIDRQRGVVHVRRVFTDGQVKLYGKQTRSLRTVPPPLRAGAGARRVTAAARYPPALSWAAWQ